MRALQLLSGVMLVTLMALAFAGCGGGGTPPTSNWGTVTEVNLPPRSLAFTPVAAKAGDILNVSADCVNTANSSDIIANVPLTYDAQTKIWSVPVEGTTAAYSKDVLGEYKMTVELITNTQTDPVVLDPITVWINVTKGGGGGGVVPPPPPW